MVKDENYTKYHSKSILHKTINNLEGILEGIKIDNVINNNEYNELRNWYSLNKEIFNLSPFDEIMVSIENALSDNYLSPEEIDDILWICHNLKSLKSCKYYNVITSDIQKLHGIIYGILADNEINDAEIHQLNQWIEDNKSLKNTYPYEEIYSLILGILEDNIITDEEKNILKVFFSDFIDTTTSYNVNQLEIDELKKEIHIDGICAAQPEIIVKDNLFCFTGTSTKTSRKDFSNLITSLGGLYKDDVVSATKYLVVGNEGNPCWAFSCYGRKIQKAMDFRKKGKDITIVNENDFWNTIKTE